MAGEIPQQQRGKARAPTLLPSVFGRNDEQETPQESHKGSILNKALNSSQSRQQTSKDDANSAPDRGETLPTQSGTPRYTPLFTLIEDSMTGEQHHPYVHYVFSDDDPDIITQSALRALDPEVDLDDQEGGSIDPALRTKGERSIIVDTAEDGQTITNARSLSPEWQVYEHFLTMAPSFGDSNSTSEEGLMLRLVGRGPSLPRTVGNKASEASPDDERSDQQLLDQIEALSQQFSAGLKDLQKLVSSLPQEVGLPSSDAG